MVSITGPCKRSFPRVDRCMTCNRVVESESSFLELESDTITMTRLVGFFQIHFAVSIKGRMKLIIAALGVVVRMLR
jgi:hypothetical protein